ncbi:hypothetical protein TanjilG_30876 [Lupinus angustifolius]|uniref:Uncharacterized protein n=1 Tax=Lupinus angustifolius TaxID=3871 RepID=A0A394D8T6_LUPAN|nr:hypothetical protein TanjilG_30876 [Lupinus angustifolius]
MKEFIDLEFQNRKNSGRDFREIVGDFCNRLRKWRQKQKLKKNSGGEGVNCNIDEGFGARRLKETQSEVGEFSIDAARMSMNGYGYDLRFSFDAARASWDGYMLTKACPRFSPMVHVNSAVDDNKVLVEEEEEEEGVNLGNIGEHCPGGSLQTKDYYLYLHARKSFDRSSSHRKTSMTDVDYLKVVSNSKVSLATTELFYGAKVLITEKDLGHGNVNNVQSDCVMASTSKAASDVVTQVDRKGLKKLHKWGRLWNKLGLVQRRKEDKLGEEYG